MTVILEGRVSALMMICPFFVGCSIVLLRAAQLLLKTVSSAGGSMKPAARPWVPWNHFIYRVQSLPEPTQFPAMMVVVRAKRMGRMV